MVQVVAESRRMLAVLAAKGGEHTKSERLLEEAAQAFEETGDRWQVANVLTTRADLALERGEVEAALVSLREALRFGRDSGSGLRVSETLPGAIVALWYRGRVREAATLLGAAQAIFEPLPQDVNWLRRRVAAVATAVPSAGLDQHRVAGRRISVQQAADLALRVLDEELALAAAAAASGSEAAGEAPLISGRSQAFRER